MINTSLDLVPVCWFCNFKTNFQNDLNKLPFVILSMLCGQIFSTQYLNVQTIVTARIHAEDNALPADCFDHIF